MSKKPIKNTTQKRTLAQREAYHTAALQKLQVRKQIEELRKKLK